MPAAPSEDVERQIANATSRREGLIEAFAEAANRLAARSARFDALVAQRARIAESDLLSLRFILSRGGATAGELTALTGLTGGAITGIMNRLEARALARRESDPGDRRKTIVRPRSAAVHKIAPIYDKLNDAVAAALGGYNEREIEIAYRIIESAAAALLEEFRRKAAKPSRRPASGWEKPQRSSEVE